jgi:hypothetical protein
VKKRRRGFSCGGGSCKAHGWMVARAGCKDEYLAYGSIHDRACTFAYSILGQMARQTSRSCFLLAALRAFAEDCKESCFSPIRICLSKLDGCSFAHEANFLDRIIRMFSLPYPLLHTAVSSCPMPHILAAHSLPCDGFPSHHPLVQTGPTQHYPTIHYCPRGVEREEGCAYCVPTCPVGFHACGFSFLAFCTFARLLQFFNSLFA